MVEGELSNTKLNSLEATGYRVGPGGHVEPPVKGPSNSVSELLQFQGIYIP